MTTRRNQLRSLFGTQPDESTTPAPETKSAVPSEAPKRTTSGAVKAMGLSLGSLSQEVEDARRLRDALNNAEQIVEIDPVVIQSSPFLDRLSDGAVFDESFEELKESIAEHGQQVPILLRPHPDANQAAEGIYQIAYGHRRVAALRSLGLKAKAFVRPLSDAELVVAQGKENAEHRPLSFIERAFFAKSLIDHGFDRATVMASLSVHKSEMSRLLQVAEMIPTVIVQAVGPAPKAGRPRWLAIGNMLVDHDLEGRAMIVISSEAFHATQDSDERFAILMDGLQSGRRLYAEEAGISQKIEPVKALDGTPLGELTRSKRQTKLLIRGRGKKGFADFVASELPALHAAYLAKIGDKSQSD